MIRVKKKGKTVSTIRLSKESTGYYGKVESTLLEIHTILKNMLPSPHIMHDSRGYAIVAPSIEELVINLLKSRLVAPYLYEIVENEVIDNPKYIDNIRIPFIGKTD